MSKIKKEVFLDKSKITAVCKAKNTTLSQVSQEVGMSKNWLSDALDRSNGRVRKPYARECALVLGVDMDDILVKDPEPAGLIGGGLNENNSEALLLNVVNILTDIKQILTLQQMNPSRQNTRSERDEQKDKLVRFLHSSMLGRRGGGVLLKDFKTNCKTGNIDMTGLREIIRDEGFDLVKDGNGAEWIVRKGGDR